jgi:hypothetical protein
MMADSTANFYLDNYFNAVFDITWSFQYSVTGLNASGGFATFLFDSNILQGGEKYESIGVLPEDINNLEQNGGIEGHALSIIFKSDNKIYIYSNSNFALLTSFSLNSSLSPFIKTYEDFNTIRFNLTNDAQILNISFKNKNINRYEDLISINTGLLFYNDKLCKIGFSYSTPLTANGNKCLIKLKDIHVQGKIINTEIDYRGKPFYPIQNTNYILESPSNNNINIGNPVPESIGSLIYLKS